MLNKDINKEKIMERLELIKKLTLTPGISGAESKVAKIMIDELGGKAGYTRDNMGSVIFEFKGSSQRPKIIFQAHMDEIGFIVADMQDNGFIKIQPIGGWDPNTLMSSPVEVINSKGEKYTGIIGSVPVHFQKNGSGKVEMNNLFVDVGATSKQDLRENFGINLGDQIVPVTNFHYSEKNNRIFSKAFDDRAGIAAVIELGKKLADMEHPNTVYCAGSVQEEVGTRGAKVIGNYTEADIAIILEGAPADDIPGIPGTPQTCIGGGAHVRIYDPTMLVKQELKNFIIEAAEEHGIKYQVTVRKGGGTDGKEMHTSRMGIPAIVLGVPVRFAHSHNCHISLDDFDELMKLVETIVRKLDENALNTIIG